MDVNNAQVQTAGKQELSPETTEIFANLFDFYGTLDADGRVLQLDGEVFDTTNTDPTLLIGQKFCETVFWQSSEVTSQLLEKAIERAVHGRSSKQTLDFRVSADEKITMEVSVIRLPDREGETEVFISGQSIVGRTGQAAKSKAASEHLLFSAENAAIGLWYWDLDKGEIDATPRCNELFGLPAYDTFTYEGYRKAIHPDDRELVDSALEASRRGGQKYKEEFRVIYPDGSMEWISAEGRSFNGSDGKPQRMTGVVQKITEQKLAAEELARVHEREKKAREEAVLANKAKDFFIAFVSHELRSPLNAILGWARILLSKELDPARHRTALETIERSANVQTKLINDLVDSARVASGKLRLEYRATNLYDIVRNSVQAQSPTAESKNLDLQFRSDSESVVLFGDASRLHQVFGNLISNAIKFTPNGGKVSVEIETAAETVQVRVSDTGYGIDAAALPHIFKQFSQGEVEQTKTNVGLGLGLSIVKILVSKHGGSVTAESAGVGKGSRFTVTLPVTEAGVIPPEKVPSGPLTRGRPLEGRSILIVEDDPDSREVLELFLVQNGATVRSYDSVRAALANFGGVSNALPNIIISDLGMPDEDGYSLISKIRSLSPETGGQVPAIALSAFTSEESRQKALDLGFNKYCTKPFEHDLLIRNLVELLEKNNSGAHKQVVDEDPA